MTYKIFLIHPQVRGPDDADADEALRKIEEEKKTADDAKVEISWKNVKIKEKIRK